MARRSSSSERNKKILVVVGGILVFVLIYQFFLNTGPAPRPRATKTDPATGQSPAPPAQSSAPAQNPERAAAPRGDDAALLQQQLSDTTPLSLSLLRAAEGSAKVGGRGNIFAYYVPPPTPPPPPPPPPPITVQALQPPSAVAGTPRAFTLTVRGQAFVEDAQIIMDGRPKPTKRIDASTLTTEIAPAEYSSARNMNVEVRSQSDPVKIYSNPVAFVVQPAPEPPFKYVGRLGDQGLFEMSGDRRIERLKAGSTIQGVWRIDSIADARVEVTHTQHGIKKVVPLADKGR